MAANGDVRTVMVGVGAAFDFIAGRKRQAPNLMQRLGLEWLFRLVNEPRRLWRRVPVSQSEVRRTLRSAALQALALRRRCGPDGQHCDERRSANAMTRRNPQLDQPLPCPEAA